MLTVLVTLQAIVGKSADAVVSRVRKAARGDAGATAVEYGLMVALIAAVIAGIVFTLGQSTHAQFTKVNNCVSSVTATNCP